MDQGSNRYYRKVAPEQVEQLMHFRSSHIPKQALIQGCEWEYLSSGNPADPTLLFLPGALSTAESAWRTISRLETSGYRMIIPNYPTHVDSMCGLVDGLTEILKLEGASRCYLAGGSYGGMLAQVFVHRYPGMVTKLVLSHTYPPVARRATSIEPALRLFKYLPLFLVRRMIRQRMVGILPSNPTPELLLTIAQVNETVDKQLTRQAAVNTYLRMMDFDRQAYTPSDLENWQGKTLILLAEDDATTPADLREALIALYPGAKVHMFAGSGHATSILEAGEYIKVMDEFLRD